MPARRKEKEKPPQLTPAQIREKKVAEAVAEYMTFHRACYLGRVNDITNLMDSKQLNVADEKDGNTGFITAAKHGHTAAVKLLANSKADVNLKGNRGMTAMHHVASNNHFEIMQFLMEECGADVKVLDVAGNSIISNAARSGHMKFVESLVEHKADLNIANAKKVTPLMAACLQGHLACVESLIKRNADVNAADSQGNTSLHMAAQAGYSKVIRRLLLSDSKIDAKNAAGKTAADVSCDDSIRDLITSYSQSQ